jgi:hypothetical protein
MKKLFAVLGVILVIGSCVGLIKWLQRPRSGHVKDEALLAGVKAEYFKAADEDYFHDMDGGVPLSPVEVQGRNTWLVWTAGNDRLWDHLSVSTAGVLDFLKTISSYPGLKASRDNRWDYLGLVNEPCFVKATGPDPERYGLWLDKRSPDCPKDPFENEQKYPGVKIGARGKNLPAGSYYGYATGIVGLRLFPNPAFDEKAKKAWDSVKYYTDSTYYSRKDLIKPYRVGMSCAFCHVGPNPIKPPNDPNHPKWENLSSNVGAQYFWIDRIFDWESDPKNFVFQLFHTSRPGTLDTSLISTDSINNPRTMNAVYLLGPRLAEAKRWGKEQLTGGQQDNHQFNDYVNAGSLTEYYKTPDTVWTPRVLKDGSDSVGALGALNRVYLNIGTFSEEWLLHFNALVGGKDVTPIPIKVARENSSYFAATESQTFAMAAFFLKTTGQHHLKDADEHAGDKYLKASASTLLQGKVVFAENCARCHSSKQPKTAEGLDPNGCAGKDYLSCWNKYWEWTKTPEFKQQMREIVIDENFLQDNYLSAEFRVPVTLLHTNACSPLATNALAGNIWDNFSSQSYKDLPSVGDITYYDPVTGEPHKYTMPDGGRGYTRPPSLISLWSTAPYLLNNSVGVFDVDPSVDGRMRSFNASIEQMLWPEKRARDSKLGDKVPGMIDRTTEPSYISVSAGYLPGALQKGYALGQEIAPRIFGAGGIVIGPIPQGTPVGLLTNINPLSDDSSPGKKLEHNKALIALVAGLNDDLRHLGEHPSDEQATAVLRKRVNQLLELSKCRDLVVNRGHYFGTDYVEPGEDKKQAQLERGSGLSDSDKRALIEFLKTF